MTRPETPRLEELQEALDRGDLDAARKTLVELNARERAALEREMGSEAFQRALGAAARGARRGKLGKVLVLPGIMGTELDSVDRKGDADRIWINFVRLISGRLRDLKLDPQGEPANEGIHVRPAGVHRKTYLALLMELDSRWNVRPFPFDWREDIDKSADRLDGEVRAFGAGDPVHFVAHSMGGLVSRRFIDRHAETWQAMNDTTGNGRGGRLVMLGTPNRGSFAIPLTLTGAEKVFKLLATADVPNSPQELLDIIGTFPGLYQMLPSRLVDLQDDHEDLFDSTRWGRRHVSGALLTKADAFIRALHRVIDPDRLLYIAGANLETPFKIHIGDEGRFTYEATLDGDGRVPHELGLLEGVTTYWVDRGVHGDLAKHRKVLDAITELLATGRTEILSTKKPERPRDRSARSGPISAARFDKLPAEVDAILARPRGQRAVGAEPSLTPEEQIQLENLGLAEWLGTGEDTPVEVRGGPTEEEVAVASAAPPGTGRPTRTRPLKIQVEVVWGDVVQVDADVHAVGHYQGVLPQSAERALDCAVSGLTFEEARDPKNQTRLVISEHTRRGQLRGALGDVSFFPLPRVARRGGVVAVAGMGHPGTFDLTALRLLIRELTLAVVALPKLTRISTVLIGSGEGTLSIERAVRGLLEGVAEALDGLDTSMRPRPPKLIVVELYRERAEEMRRCLEMQAQDIEDAVFVVAPEITPGSNGRVSVEGCFELVIDSTLRAARAREGSNRRLLFEGLMGEISSAEGLRRTAIAEMTKLADTGRTAGKEWQRSYRIGPRPRDAAVGSDIPTRISFTWDNGVMRIAAITGSTTVSERVVQIEKSLIDELVARMTQPKSDDLAAESGDGAVSRGEGLSRDLARLLIPREFREVLRKGPYIVEVDRTMARVHWEACSQFSGGAPVGEPMGLDQLARQLRTLYSPAPAPAPYRSGSVRALVIGDPGDPANREDLPGAREEALAVDKLLRDNGVETELLIGAPDGEGRGPIPGIAAAARFEVLRRLLRGGFDLVHYAGHGDFDEQRPDRAGWLFKGGLLTSAEFERVDEVPSLMVANACLSARTAQALARGTSDTDPRAEAALLPSLADEFFHLGVRNYIGTAWEVNDIGATFFATTFYQELFTGCTYGEAVSAARTALHDRRATYGPLWAAYQHYGDPTGRLRAAENEVTE